MTTTTPARDAGPAPLLMPDYCEPCVREHGCSRAETVTEPQMSEWSGGSSMVVATYACPCGHVWTCHWSADHNPYEESEA